MSSNYDRAQYGIDMVREATEQTNAWNVEDADTAYRDAGAYLLHVAPMLGLDPEDVVRGWLDSFYGDREDGPYASKSLDPEKGFHEQDLEPDVPEDDDVEA